MVQARAQPRTPKTSAISSRAGSVCRTPASTLVYRIGKAIRNETATESRRDGTHMSSSTTKEATGAALTAPTNGARSPSTTQDLLATAARAIPAATARPKPAATRPSERPTETQKSPWQASSASRHATSAGPTSTMREPTAMLASCQAASQNAATPRRRPHARTPFFPGPAVMPPANAGP